MSGAADTGGGTRWRTTKKRSPLETGFTGSHSIRGKSRGTRPPERHFARGRKGTGRGLG